MKKMPLLAVLLLATAQVLCATPTQWTIASGGNDHWYELVNSNFSLWPQARAQAAAMAGYLATLTSPEENAWVLQNVLSGASPTTSPWIGAADFSLIGEWEWVEGPEAGQLFWENGVGTITFSNWGTVNDPGGVDEPNNCCAGPEFWLAINPTSGKWLDLFAAPEPFLVEFDPTPGSPAALPEPGTIVLIGSGLVGLGLLRGRFSSSYRR